MSKEVMRQALEALEDLIPLCDPGFSICYDVNKAITALREALVEQPAQQEPVAHRDGFWCTDLTCKKCYSADFRFKHKNSVVNESLTTPAQRTWVGLTDEEIDKTHETKVWDARRSYARAIEAKLKEKNT